MKPVVSISLTVLFTAFAASAQAQESFRVELGRDGETIADMRPVFLEFQSQQKLPVDTSDCLNTLMNLKYALMHLIDFPISRR